MRTRDDAPGAAAPEPSGSADLPSDDFDPDFLDDPDPSVDDADAGADAVDDGPEEPDDLDPQPEPRRRETGRAARRIESLAERLRVAEARLAANEGRQQLPDPRAAQQAAADEERQFNESLVGLMPEEIAARVTARSERRIGAQMAQMELRAFDRTDKADYQRHAQSDRFATQNADKVEQYLSAMRAQGIYQFSRLDVLDKLVGEQTRLNRQKVNAQQRRDGARRVARETVRPGSGRGDAGSGGARRRGEDDADLALLKGTRAADVTW